MLERYLHASKKTDEIGFTLVELLVVIVIIGLLAAIAIPIFMNQRQRANDAAVESDIRNIVAQIESMLVSEPNATYVSDVDPDTMDEEVPEWTEDSTEIVVLRVRPPGSVATDSIYSEPIPITDGVHIDVSGHPNDDPSGNKVGSNNCGVRGWHDNGSQYTSWENSAYYRSAAGGFTDPPAQDEEEDEEEN